MRRPLLLTTCALLLAGSPASTAPAEHHVWRTYVNARFGYAICFPSDLLKAQGEAPNGDGQTFVGAGGAELAVFGANNVQNASLPALVKDYSSSMAGRDGTITYQVVRSAWAVYSGANAATVFYSKVMTRADQYIVMELRYDRGRSATYSKLVPIINRCLKLGRPAF